MQLQSIIATLLMNFDRLTNDLKELQNAIPALKLLKEMLLRVAGEPNEALVSSIDKFNEFYQKMATALQERKKIPRNSPELETFK